MRLLIIVSTVLSLAAACTAPQKKQQAAAPPPAAANVSDADYFGDEGFSEEKVNDDPFAGSPASKDAMGYLDDNQMEGYASWYGKNHQGRITASGESFDTEALTAAHRSLPYGSKVRVVNTENNKSAVFTVNDRGPFVDGRIIDVTRLGAEQLGFIEKGYAKVKLEVISEGTETAQADFKDTDDVIYENEPVAAPPVQKNGPSGYTVQVGAFKDEKNAMQLKDKLLSQYQEKVFISKSTLYYIVWVGDFPSLAAAKNFRTMVKNDGFNEAFIFKNNS